MQKKYTIDFTKKELDLILFCFSISSKILEEYLSKEKLDEYSDIISSIIREDNKIFGFLSDEDKEDHTSLIDTDYLFELFYENIKDFITVNEGIVIIEDEEEKNKLYFASNFLKTIISEVKNKNVSKYYKYVPDYSDFSDYGPNHYKEYLEPTNKLIEILKEEFKKDC